MRVESLLVCLNPSETLPGTRNTHKEVFFTRVGILNLKSLPFIWNLPSSLNEYRTLIIYPLTLKVEASETKREISTKEDWMSYTTNL